MAFATENTIGLPPTLPEIQVLQGGSPRISLQLTVMGSTAPLNCVAALSQQDGVDHADWAATGGSVSVIAKETWDSEPLFEVSATAADATEGQFNAVIPSSGTEEDGMFFIAATLKDSSGSPVSASVGYMEVIPSLSASHDRRQRPLSVRHVRRMLRDAVPEGNRILEQCEFSSGEVMEAITETVEEWNYTPPILYEHTYTHKTFPAPVQLADGVIARLLERASLWYQRNAMRLNGAGVPADDTAKAGDYLQMADYYRKRWESWMGRTKYQINAESGWGFISSGI